MLYRFDDFIKDNPTVRPVFFNPFKESKTMLHEMTVQEISDTFKPCSKNTAFQRANAFNRYFNWLNEQGIDVPPKLSFRDFNLLELDKKYIFDADDFFKVYDDLIFAAKKHNTIINKSFNEDFYVTFEVVCLLLWYGISVKKMLKIQLSDVTKDGIAGCDIAFDERVINVFMRYKSMDSQNICRGKDERDRVADFKQQTFIRNYSDKPVTKAYITNNVIAKLTILEPEDLWISKLFNATTLYDNGIFVRIYANIGNNFKGFEKAAEKEGLIFNNTSLKSVYKKRYKEFSELYDEYKSEKETEEEAVKEVKSEQSEPSSQDNDKDLHELIDRVVENANSVPTINEQIEQLNDITLQDNDKSNIVNICLECIKAIRATIELQTVQLNTMEQVLKELSK